MIHVRLPRHFPVVGLAAAIVLAAALGPAGRARVDAQAPPPPPPPSVPGPTPAASIAPTAAGPSALPSGPIQAVPSAEPSGSPAPRGRRGRHKAPDTSASASPEPSATPTSPAFATLDGTWEMQLQFIDRTEYSYLVIEQKDGGTLAGTWRQKNHSWPFEGTYDGRLIRLLVKEDSGNVTLSGYVEGASDMVGTLDTGTEKGAPTAFTAEHRASTKGAFKKK